MSVEGRLCLVLQSYSSGPPSLLPTTPQALPLEKRQPSRFCRRFLNIFNIVSFKRNVLHSSSKEQRTELLTVALALTALASTLFPRKVSFQVLIGQSLRGKMRDAASPAFQHLSVGAESQTWPELRLPSRVDRAVATMASIPPWGVSVRTFIGC